MKIETIVLGVAARHFRTEIKDITGKCRYSHLVLARKYVSYYMRKNTLATLSGIGSMTNRDHSNVVFHVKDLESIMEVDKKIKVDYENFVAEIENDKKYFLSPNEMEESFEYVKNNFNSIEDEKLRVSVDNLLKYIKNERKRN